MNTQIQKVTQNIIERSKPYRETYLSRLNEADSNGVNRSALGCSNLAHGFAACSQGDKDILSEDVVPNIAIVSAYNDMLSAHQPFATYPEIIKQALKDVGATAQFAGGVPAMCDGVTQSQPGMELSLFSRDVIAQATAIALSHNMFDDVNTVMGKGLESYTQLPELDASESSKIKWTQASLDITKKDIVGTVSEPFSHHGGLSILDGNVGRSVIKTSALKEKHLLIEAPAEVFDSQEELQDAYQAGQLNKDFVAVVRYQGPKSNGMPELHGLLPPLGALQDEGYNIAIVTDGRMSGASGKVASAIHMTPEASEGGMISKIMQGDMIRLDVENSSLELLVDADELETRKILVPDMSGNRFSMGRELFVSLRQNVSGAEEGASIFSLPGEESA
ncbi:UNVERIFIED_CONTAM: hypothetical protein GTU68_022351 [Idotea baltica]|nr:hypothetical protein [Idotea baltica]